MTTTRPEETAKRIRLSPEERRAQLIELGLEMLGDRAIEDISISEIANRAGISRGLLFHYFPTKQDYQLAVLRRAAAGLLHRIAPDPESGAFEMLRDSVGRYVDYAAENRTTYLALLRGPSSVNPELSGMIDETRNAIVRLILDVAPIADEDKADPRLALAVRGWIAFTEEITLSWLRGESITRAELLDLLVESLLSLTISINPALAAALRS
ncbi:TetR/AcrR family transcriptional regulator [Nocardia paucivorans]|uniref:TetR/AcrR family transcriptional regulator n=1 Tax=Nocardia paucivorans TaxID=114259 RepID=UPI0002F36BE3|nr:TetR/AcrR family transcriptional regulator [Nocardia paucivorans]